MNISFLSQLINSMGEAVIRLEEAEKSNNRDYSNKLKEFILNIQKRIKEELNKNP